MWNLLITSAAFSRLLVLPIVAVWFAYSMFSLRSKACSFRLSRQVFACDVWSQQVKVHYTIFSVQGVGVLKEWGQEVNRCSYSASPHLQIQKPAERVLFVDESLILQLLCSRNFTCNRGFSVSVSCILFWAWRQMNACGCKEFLSNLFS